MLYTMVPTRDTGPNTGAPSGAGGHWEHVGNNSGSLYISFSLNEEEWFGLDTFAEGIPLTDVVVGCRLRSTGTDPDANGDILRIGTRRGGVIAWLETTTYDVPGSIATVINVAPIPARSEIDTMSIGASCTNQTGAEVRLSYLVLEVETNTFPVNGPIIAGDEDAMTMEP